MTATSHSPSAMAAAACSTWTSKLDPPTLVLSVHLGWMPRYSASSIDGANPLPAAQNTASTSVRLSPASASASRTMAASMPLPRIGSSPVGDTASVTPTTAALARASRPSRLPVAVAAIFPLEINRIWPDDTGGWGEPARGAIANTMAHRAHDDRHRHPLPFPARGHGRDRRRGHAGARRRRPVVGRRRHHRPAVARPRPAGGRRLDGRQPVVLGGRPLHPLQAVLVSAELHVPARPDTGPGRVPRRQPDPPLRRAARRDRHRHLGVPRPH